MWSKREKFDKHTIYEPDISKIRMCNLKSYGGLGLWDLTTKVTSLQVSLVVQYITASDRLSWMTHFAHYLERVRSALDIHCSPLVRQARKIPIPDSCSFRFFNNLINAFNEYEITRKFDYQVNDTIASWSTDDQVSRVFTILSPPEGQTVKVKEVVSGRVYTKVLNNLLDVQVVNGAVTPLTEEQWRSRIVKIDHYNFGAIKQIDIHGISTKLLYHILYFLNQKDKLQLTEGQKHWRVEFLPLWELLSTAKIRNKIKEFLWRALNNNINVNAKLSHYMRDVPTWCKLCRSCKETALHRVSSCEFVQNITSKFRMFWLINTGATLPINLNIFNIHQVKKRRVLALHLYTIVLYISWLHRNNITFNKSPIQLTALFRKEVLQFYRQIALRLKIKIQQTDNVMRDNILLKANNKWSVIYYRIDSNCNVVHNDQFNWD